jgi:hypothetical protein
LAKKKTQTKRVASIDPNGILVRDLKGTAIWIGVAAVVVAVLAVLERTLF